VNKDEEARILNRDFSAIYVEVENPKQYPIIQNGLPRSKLWGMNNGYPIIERSELRGIDLKGIQMTQKAMASASFLFRTLNHSCSEIVSNFAFRYSNLLAAKRRH
jgi:hypothetical protein